MVTVTLEAAVWMTRARLATKASRLPALITGAIDPIGARAPMGLVFRPRPNPRYCYLGRFWSLRDSF
jgi:hypothetical protein